jgi:hypothetical protein
MKLCDLRTREPGFEDKTNEHAYRFLTFKEPELPVDG